MRVTTSMMHIYGRAPNIQKKLFFAKWREEFIDEVRTMLEHTNNTM